MTLFGIASKFGWYKNYIPGGEVPFFNETIANITFDTAIIMSIVVICLYFLLVYGFDKSSADALTGIGLTLAGVGVIIMFIGIWIANTKMDIKHVED